MVLLLLFSDIKTDDLSWWNLQLLIDSSLQVLIEQRFKLFVLLVQQTGLLDEVLAIDQHLIVLCERRIEGIPNRKLLVSEDLGHLRPIHLIRFFLTACISSFVR